MTIESIKGVKIPAGPGTSWIAEAEVTEDGEKVFVTVQLYDGEECTVSKDSVYAFMTDEDVEPAEEFLEEYEELDVAIEDSKYGEVFSKLSEVLEMLG